MRRRKVAIHEWRPFHIELSASGRAPSYRESLWHTFDQILRAIVVVLYEGAHECAPYENLSKRSFYA
jgi:hypothetical protein